MQRGVMLIAVLLVAGLVGTSVSAEERADKAVGANPIGKPVTIYSASGEQAAQITVKEVVDPFEDWSEYADPQRGERYVLLTVEIRVTGERPFEFEEFSFYLLDSIGHLYSLGYLLRSDQSMVDNPDLEGSNLLPGETASGALGYRLPEVAELTNVVFTGYADVQYLYLLADLSKPADKADRENS